MVPVAIGVFLSPCHIELPGGGLTGILRRFGRGRKKDGITANQRSRLRAVQQGMNGLREKDAGLGACLLAA
jgi:hypothetical protein